MQQSKITGIFFIAATVTAITASVLYNGFIHSSDLASNDYSTTKVISGVFFELLLACSNIGTAIMLYPYLKKYNESAGLGYVIFRTLEVIFILISAISVLSLLSLTEYQSSENPAAYDSFTVTYKLLLTIHSWANILGPNFMLGINTFIYSMIFYKSGLVPSKLSIYGIFSAILIFTVSILELFGLSTPFSLTTLIMAFPIFSYEMILAGYLIKQGFNEEYSSNNPVYIYQ